MDAGIAPTRSNLMKVKDELAFSKLGYELLDQKRSILVSELLTLVDQAVDYQNRVEKSLKEAERALQDAIMHMGRLRLGNLAGAVSITSEIELGKRKVMGVSLPKVHTSFCGEGPFFSPEGTSMLSEVALEKYQEALRLMGQMAELKVSIMRLSREVKKTIRKVNALERERISFCLNPSRTEWKEKTRRNNVWRLNSRSGRYSFILMDQKVQ